jgi:Zn-dependent peptidase ImmA (M78 family)
VSWIKDEVSKMCKKYKTNNPYELASMMNIQVIPWNLHEEINGFYKYDKRNKYIFINSNLDYECQSFVCCHELGHAVCHPRANTPFLRKNTLFSIDRIEVEANTFAIELLIRNANLEEDQIKSLSIFELTKLCGIPNELAYLIKANFFGQ